jgi:hypothetical protein
LMVLRSSGGAEIGPCSFLFGVCWLGMGWMTWRFFDHVMSQPTPPGVAVARSDGDCFAVLIAWPIFWGVMAILSIACVLISTTGLDILGLEIPPGPAEKKPQSDLYDEYE